MRRLTDHALLVAGTCLLLCPQAFATSTTCAYPHTPGMGNENDIASAQARRAVPRAVPRDASQPAVAVPPEVLNLQLRPPARKL